MIVGVGLANHAFSGFPKGYDAYGHMSKIKFLVDYFPNADWNSEWYSGAYFSEASFPPLFHYVGAILVGWFGLSLQGALLVLAVLSFVVIGLGLFGFVRVVTSNHLAAVISALLLVSTNAFWSYPLHGGLYPRIAGMAFLILFSFFAALYFVRRSSAAYLAMLLSLAATLSSHLLLGAIGVALAVLMVSVLPLAVGQRVVLAAKVLIPTALLVAYFYLPYFAALARPAPVPTFTRQYDPVSIGALLVTTEPGAPIYSLPFFFVPIAVVVPAFVYFQSSVATLGRRLMPVLAIASVASLLYALIGLPAPGFFIYNFQPGQALFFVAWFGAALIGIAVSGVASSRLPRVVLPLVAVALLGLIAVMPARIAYGVVSGDNAAKRQLMSALSVDPSDTQHRIGVNWDGGSDWINATFDLPQTRGYQQQSVVNSNWQYWLETRVWTAETNYDEKNFLLDWYAVRSFYGGPDAAVRQRFDSRPDLYVAQPSGQAYDMAAASPILSARTTRAALVIGSDAAYNYLFRALAITGFDSESMIPVRGGEFLDDHGLPELRQFDLVVLYGFQARNVSASFRILDQYVRGGGNLLIEANGSPLQQADAPPPPVPGSAIRAGQVGSGWKLTSADSAITNGIDVGAFAPAVYKGGQWGISYIPQSALASWAQPVLLSDGRPVLVAGTLGSGHVVWSGLNLPYHSASTQTAVESRLLDNMIAWVAPHQSAPPEFEASFVNPQLRRITVGTTAEGVLLKESWVPNWHATVNGRSAAIYRAGPDFMYVPVRSATYPVRVEFVFERTYLEWFGDGVSVLTLVALLAWFVRDLVRRRRFAS